MAMEGVPLEYHGASPGTQQEALESLLSAAATVLPGHTARGRLLRTALNCLIKSGLYGNPGHWCLSPVATASLGELLGRAASGDRDQAALYRTAGHRLADVLQGLEAQGLVTFSYSGKSNGTKLVLIRSETLLAPPATPQAAGVEFDLDLRPNPLQQGQRARALRWLSDALDAALVGASTEIRLQRYAVECLLRQGLVKTASWRFKQLPVELPAATRFFEQAICHLTVPGRAANFRSHFMQAHGGSLISLLRAPECRSLVQLTTEGHQHFAQLLVHHLLNQKHHAGGLAADSSQHPPAHLGKASGDSTAQDKPPGLRPSRVQPQPSDRALAAGGAAAATQSSPVSGKASGHAASSGVTSAQEASVAANGLLQLPAAEVVTTKEQAEAVVQLLLEAEGGVAMSCALDRATGTVSAVQLYAPSVSDAAYLFRLSSLEPWVCHAAMAQVAELTQHCRALVLHDCRSPCPALLREYGIRCTAVWDPQVAFALLQFISSLGTPDAAAGVDPPIALAELLNLYQLPAAQGEEGSEQAAECTGAEVWQLLQARARLEHDLGPAASLRVEALSCVAAARGGSEEDSGGRHWFERLLQLGAAQ